MDIFVRDLHSGTPERVSVDSSGDQQNGRQKIDGAYPQEGQAAEPSQLLL
jgi:hypothetical protein